MTSPKPTFFMEEPRVNIPLEYKKICQDLVSLLRGD